MIKLCFYRVLSSGSGFASLIICFACTPTTILLDCAIETRNYASFINCTVIATEKHKENITLKGRLESPPFHACSLTPGGSPQLPSRMGRSAFVFRLWGVAGLVKEEGRFSETQNERLPLTSRAAT
jgi:hypothetical protein